MSEGDPLKLNLYLISDYTDNCWEFIFYCDD